MVHFSHFNSSKGIMVISEVLGNLNVFFLFFFFFVILTSKINIFFLVTKILTKIPLKSLELPKYP